MKILDYVLRIEIAIILLQSLYFKFTAAPESVYIFSLTGLGSFGRIGTGIIELLASILIFIPRYTWLGAILSICVMFGALFFHLTTLGIEVQNDGGLLFYMALIVLMSSTVVLFIHRKTVPIIGKKFIK